MAEHWDALRQQWQRLARSLSAPSTVPLTELLAPYQSFADAVRDALSKEGAAADPAAALADTLESLRAQLRDDPACGDLGGWFAVPMAWANNVPGAGVWPGQEQVQDLIMKWSEEFLDLPLLGPQREWQGAWQALVRAALEEQRAREAAERHYRGAAELALERFAGFLRNDDARVDSLRTLYDHWVAIAEQAYHERVMEAGFSRDFAAWVNAGSRTRSALTALQERVAGLFDWPTRGELDALHTQQRELRKQLELLRRDNAELKAAREAATAANVNAAAPAARTPSARTRAQAKPGPRAGSNASDASAAGAAPSAAPARGATKRPRAAAKRRRKPALDEFDIGHILGDGKAETS